MNDTERRHIQESPQSGEIVVDCERGRLMGCRTFCCSLIVRLQEGERDPTQPQNERKHCIDKDPVSGRCVHQEEATDNCSIWTQRPLACRAYDCNQDWKLQVVLERGFTSVMKLVEAEPTPGGERRTVPYVTEARHDLEDPER